MVDFLDAKMKAEVSNLLDGDSEMTYMSADSLSVRLSSALRVDFFLVDTKDMNKGYYTRLVNWLKSIGYTLTASSKNNSYYLEKDSITIRISDHIKNDSVFTFQIFLSQFGNSYAVFYEKQFIPISSLKELKNFIIQSEIITALKKQKLEHGLTPYKQMYELQLEKNKELKKEFGKLKREFNDYKNSNPAKQGTLNLLEKAQKKIGCQAMELRRLNEELKKYRK